MEGYYVPVNAISLMNASDQEAGTAYESLLESHGDAIRWLANH